MGKKCKNSIFSTAELDPTHILLNLKDYASNHPLKFENHQIEIKAV
jgi:hypothetical protein